jgi:hypothetical protein
MRPLRLSLLLPIVVLIPLLSGCPALGLVKPQSTEAQILSAYQTVDAVIVSADAAYNAKLITKAEGQAVANIAHQVVPILDAAKAANAANDTANANKAMNLVNTLLAGLKAYVPTQPAK